MGGQSSSTQTQNGTQSGTQSSTTNPWSAATPTLSGILGQLGGGLSNTGLSSAENSALATLKDDSINFGTSWLPQITANATNLFNGGGAKDQAGAVNANYQRYVDQTNPLASNTNYNPYDTPGFRDALNTLSSDITNNVNGSFAAAGRDFSGMNSQTLGRGLAQGLAPTIAAQYNQNVNNQQNAAGNLYGAGNTNSGILSGMQQQYVNNQLQGTSAAGQALDAENSGANATLQAEAARRGIPVQALGLLAQIGIPIAGLGASNTGASSSTSTGSTQGTQQMSGAQQFGTIAGGVGSIFGKLFPFGL